MTTCSTQDLQRGQAPRPARALQPDAPGRSLKASSEWRRGAREMLPMAIGYIPFALVVGAAIGRSPEPAAGWSATWLVYGGSAHLAVLDLLSRDATPGLAIVACLLINVRVLAYATAIAPLWAGTPWAWRLGAGALVVDPVWLLYERRAQAGGAPALRRAHYLGSGATLAGVWLLAVTAGVAVGRAPAATTHLGMAVPICLVAMVVPHLRMPGGWAAVGAGAAAALATRTWPAGTGLLLAMGAAALAGLLASRGEARP